MAEVTYNNVELAEIVLLKGSETVFSSRAYKKLIHLALQQDPNTEITVIDSRLYEKSGLYIHTSPSLFGERKVLKIENLETGNDDLYTDLIEYIQNPQPDIYLILQHSGGVRGKKLLDVLKKNKTLTVQCEPLKYPKDKLALVQSDVKRAGRTISAQASKVLVDALGSDLEGLLSATNQLLFDVEGEITIEDVNRYYGGRVETNAFNIADEIAVGNTDKAILLLRHALNNGIAPIQIAAGITTKIRSLIKVAGMQSRRMRASDIGMAPWQVDRLIPVIRKWSEKAMADALSIMAETDYAIKGGSKSPQYALEKAVIEICKMVSKSNYR